MRIVSLTCSNTEIVCALGLSHYLVGVDNHSDYPAEVVAHLPRVGPDLDIDAQRVAALKPDLVLASLTVPGHERILDRLRAAKLPSGKRGASVVNYFRDVRSELRKVVWPNRDEATKLTAVVVGLATVLGLYLGFLDLLFSELVQLILRVGSGGV